MSRSRRHCLVASVAICGLSASSAQAQTPAPQRTVAAQGVASVKVVAPKDRAHEGPIRAAVEAAEAKALPRAIAGARENATELARLAGLQLGPIISISDAQSSPYGPFFGFYGTFGPDRFCGTVRSPCSAPTRRPASASASGRAAATPVACRRPSPRR